MATRPGREVVIYVVGPYRATTTWRVARNIAAAQADALEIWKAGAMAYCPHANTALFDGELPDERFLAANLAFMRRCDAVWLMADWKLSQGSMTEHREALALGLPLFENIVDLREFLANLKASHAT